jgi:diguanylate cyclase (GGDEF)-like protein
MQTEHKLGVSYALPLLLAVVFGFFVFSGLTAINLDTGKLLVFHSVLEFTSIILGFIIFFITWYGTNPAGSARVTVVSLVILATSLMELVHTLSYLGITKDFAGFGHAWVSSWVFSRLTWSLGLLYAISLPPATSAPGFLSRKAVLYGTLLALSGVIANTVFSYNLGPYLTIDSYTHPLVVYSQYIAIAAEVLTLIILCRLNFDHVGNLPYFALVFGMLSDLSFALSIHTPYSINMAGHFFKIVADFYILRALYIVVIRKPYDEIIKLKEDMEELAAKNAKLYEDSEQQRNLFEDVLAKIGMIISSQLDLKEAVEAIADMSADLMHTRLSIIALFAKDHSALRVVGSYGISAPPEYIPLENSLAAKVSVARTALLIDDLALHPEIFRPQLIFTNIRSMICAPLVNDKEFIGVIEAYSSEKAAFDNRDALLLKALGYQAGAAVASATLYEQTKARLDEEQFLYQIAQAAASTIDIDTIVEQCTAHATRALNADVGVGYLVADAAKNSMLYKTSVGLKCKAPAFDLNSYPELKEMIAALSPSLTTADKIPPLNCDEKLTGPVMVVPLPVDHRVLGVIIFGWHRFVHSDNLQRTSFAALMAQQIALGIEKAQLYNQVKSMALSDGLTGLANRRNFDMFLNTELRRAGTLKRPLSLIMLDLDKFKIYNDTYGHTTGDKLLAQIGKILQQTTRSIDFPARYGGEEFAVILPECNNTEATAVAENIRREIEISQFPDNAGTFTAKITASLGVATYDPALGALLPDIEKFVATADEALYQAKDLGRNRVVNATVM